MSEIEKPYAPSCERNKAVILEVLRECFADRHHVLEIGSGTGQHAVHFAPALAHLVWQTSDRAANLAGLRMWLDEAAQPNTPAPLELDVTAAWPAGGFDAAFSANTLHIMSWSEVEATFAGLSRCLAADATLAIYGPFKYRGEHTSESNVAFDASLRAEFAHRGIRDFEAVDALASAAGFRLADDRAMPANNRCLIWRRGAAA